MSKYLLLSSLFLICTISSFAQKKFDNKIIVSVTDTTNIIKRVVDALNEQGYTVDQQSDKFVSTKEKSLNKPNLPSTDIKLRAFYKDGSLTFSGEFRMNMNILGSPPSFWQIENRGLKNSGFKITWQEIEGIAKQFGTVTYSK